MLRRRCDGIWSSAIQRRTLRRLQACALKRSVPSRQTCGMKPSFCNETQLIHTDQVGISTSHLLPPNRSGFFRTSPEHFRLRVVFMRSASDSRKNEIRSPGERLFSGPNGRWHSSCLLESDSNYGRPGEKTCAGQPRTSAKEALKPMIYSSNRIPPSFRTSIP